MIEEIKTKIDDIVKAILEKPTYEITKDEYTILSAEYYRLKNEIDSAENSKRMAETFASIWSK